MKPLWKNVTLWSLTLGHFSVDMLAGAMPVVVGLYLKETLVLDLAQIGLMLAIFKMSSSLTQPIFGYYSDLYGGRWFAVGGVLWMSILVAFIGFLPSFGNVVFVAALAGFGSAAFHPQGASGANVAAGPQKKTAGVAMFMLGGNMGYAVGPILAALIMEWVGVRGTALLSLVSLLTVPMLYFLTGQAQRSTPAAERKASWKIELNPAFSLLAIVALILTMSLRAWSQESFSAFLPQYFVNIAQFSREQASLLSSVMLFVLAFGSITGGMLADRFGGVRVMIVSMLISAPLTAIMFQLGDFRSFYIAPLVGFASGAAWPPMLVMAQGLFPKNAGVGTGVALGFVFAMGALGVSFTGWLAEPVNMGLYAAMLMLCLVPLITAGFALLLPGRSSEEAQVPIVQPAGAVSKG